MGNQSRAEEIIKVGITAGDLNGVGMETVMKVLKDVRMLQNITVLIYANASSIKEYQRLIGNNEFQFQSIKSPEDAREKKINVVNISTENVTITLGQPSKETGAFAFLSIKTAVEDLAANKIDVLITSPIDKDSIQGDNFNFPGHTEYLSNMSNVDDSLMFLCADDLRVGVATGHLPLKEVANHLTKEKLLSKIQLMADALEKDFGIPSPKIALLGLNPHAGDNGLLGSEEKDIIIPAIQEANAKNQLVFGPYGADGFFGSGAFKQFDGILAMYHDQGLVPFKLLAFENGVNYTAGLPIVRTSPDHGTAYNLAGKGLASESSMRHAIFMACDIYNQRRAYKEISANPLQLQKKERQ